MPQSVKNVHGGSATAKVMLERRQLVAAGTSVFLKDEEAPPQPDTSDKARCKECTPHATFVRIGDRSAAHFLARHQADKHAKRSAPTRAEVTVARERAIDAVIDRIINGSLKPGRAISITGLGEELGVSRHTMQSATEHLIEAGLLQWSDCGSFHRRVVVCQSD